MFTRSQNVKQLKTIAKIEVINRNKNIIKKLNENNEVKQIICSDSGIAIGTRMLNQ